MSISLTDALLVGAMIAGFVLVNAAYLGLI